MSFFRPEATEWLSRNVLSAIPFVISVVFIVLYLPDAINLSPIGMILVLIFAIGAYATAPAWLLQRKKRHVSDLPLKVTVTEGAINLFDPSGVLSFEIKALSKIDIKTTDAKPPEERVFWRLEAEDQMAVIVPNGIEGADNLVDALGILPGFSHLKVIKAMSSSKSQNVTIWSK